MAIRKHYFVYAFLVIGFSKSIWKKLSPDRPRVNIRYTFDLLWNTFQPGKFKLRLQIVRIIIANNKSDLYDSQHIFNASHI